MSLRMFHLLFIAVSVTLAAFFAAWSGGQFRLAHDPIYAVSAVGALAFGVGLGLYGAAFQRKTRKL